MKTIKAMVVLAVVSLAGCATFPGHVLPTVSGFPATAEKPSVSVNLSFRQYINDQPINLGVRTAETALQKKVIERFEKSGMYSSVTTASPNSDITVDVEVKDDGRGSMGMAVLTGLSLYIIPSSATDTYKVSAKVKNNKTGTENTVEFEDFVTTWQQILLLPLLPFNLAPVVANGVQNNIMDTLAIRVHEAAGKVASAPVRSATPAAEGAAHDDASNDVLKRLKTLKEAVESGLISQDDYEKKKSELMKGI